MPGGVRTRQQAVSDETSAANYSVPPGLAGRRVQIRLSPAAVVVHLEGAEIARHQRSYAPADVVLDPVMPGLCAWPERPALAFKPAM